MKENVGAASVALTPEEQHRIREAVEKIQVQGERYAEAYGKLAGR